MMHSFLIVLLAVAGVHQAYGDTMEDFFNFADTNNDGKISGVDHDAIKAALGPYAGADLKLSVDEMVAAINGIEGCPLDAAKAQTYLNMADGLVGEGADGLLDLTAGAALLARFDTNKDDAIQLSEFRAALAGRR